MQKQIEWMTGVLCNGLICQQVSSKKWLNILPCVLAKSNLRQKYKDLTKIFQDRNIYSMESHQGDVKEDIRMSS